MSTTPLSPAIPAPSFLRQLDIFDPATFRFPCHVIGTGAMGSQIASLLVHLGVADLHLYDDDILQPHNVPTGAFDPQYVGQRKVDALRAQFRIFPATTLTAHPLHVGAQERFRGVVFLCVHDMDERRLIWKHALRFQPSVPLLIETRIGALEGRIYTVEPSNSLHVQCWEAASAYPSGHDAEQPCTNRALVTTVAFVAALAVHQLILWHAQKDPPHCLSVGLDGTPLVVASRWTE